MNESTHRSVWLVYLRHYTILFDSYYPASHLVDSHSQAIHIYWRFISNYREATGLTHNNTFAAFTLGHLRNCYGSCNGTYGYHEEGDNLMAGDCCNVTDT